MKRKFSIQLKAAFLLIVFSFNTVIGFACSVGLDMGFNNKNHHDEDGTIIQKTAHHHDKTHHPGEADNDHHKSKDSKDNCCNDLAIKFTQVDKFVPQSLNAINPISLTAFFFPYYCIDVLYISYVSTSIKYFVRSYHPPISDIRIAIHRFQI
jgi:hypothetical protein